MSVRKRKTIATKTAATKTAATKTADAVAAARTAPGTPDETSQEPAVVARARQTPMPPLPEPVSSEPLSSELAQPEASGAPPAGYADLAAMGRDNLAAMAQANAALVKGFEEIGHEVAGYAQHSFASAVETARALAAVRTVADLVVFNRDLAQAAIEGALAGSARLSQIGIRTASAALGPLNECVTSVFARPNRPG